jgi:hypothetical protein
MLFNNVSVCFYLTTNLYEFKRKTVVMSYGFSLSSFYEWNNVSMKIGTASLPPTSHH